MSIDNQSNENILETQVFPEELDKTIFVERLDINDNITPHFISRKEFNAKKGNFLVEKGENKYDLYLPEDLNFLESPAIIYRVNKITFGENLPKHASTEELKAKIVITIDKLLKEDSKINNNKKAIKNCVRLYEQLSTVEEAQKLSNTEFRERIILESKKDSNILSYFKRVELAKTKELLSLLKDEIEQHIDETFFERGIEELGKIETFTREDHDDLFKKYKNNEKYKVVYSNENNPREVYNEKGKLIIYFNTIKKDLDKSEQLLRKQINIDKYKQELEKLRKTGTEIEIQKKELEATNSILKAMYQYPWQKINNYGFSPKNIKKFKEIICVGYSLLGHTFLQELGIKHKGINIPGHSALEINIGEKIYYFDRTKYSKVYEFKYKDIINYTGVYKEIELIGRKFNKEIIGHSGTTEEILQSQILYHLGYICFNEGNYNKAKKYYKKALKLNPKNGGIWINLGSIYYNKKDYNMTIECYKKGLKLDLKNTIALKKLLSIYNILGFSYNKKGDYDEAISYYEKALKLNPEDNSAWYRLGLSYKKNHNFKMSFFCIFVSKILKGENWFLKYILYGDLIEEKNKIKDFIKTEDWDGLVKFVFSFDED